MAVGLQASVAIGRETVWGTQVAPTVRLNTKIIDDQTIDRIREPYDAGHRGLPRSVQGREHTTATMSGITLYPYTVAELLRACFGQREDSGKLLHTPTTAQFSHPDMMGNPPLCALPPYTVALNRDGGRDYMFVGGQVQSLTLIQPANWSLMASVNWLFRGAEAYDDTSYNDPYNNPYGAPSRVDYPEYPEDGNIPWLFRDLTVTRGTVDFGEYVTRLNLTIDNGLGATEILNGSSQIDGTFFQKPQTITLELELKLEDTIYDTFRNGSHEPWQLSWRNESHLLSISLPNLLLENWAAPVESAGRIVVSVRGTLEVGSPTTDSSNDAIASPITITLEDIRTKSFDFELRAFRGIAERTI